ncbi:DNA replication protein [Bacteroidales bacterium Barb7]|nr:DNA replication protein [Bacteroidales bacterium Barb7]OAV76334.1 DNA replication protein [Bacteroidales bacterium Barb7]
METTPKQESRKDYKPVLLAQSNILTQARYDFNVIEKRCLYQVINEVRKRFVDSNTGQRDLFDNLHVMVTEEMLEKCSDGTHLKIVCDSLKRLRKRDIEIEDEDTWVNTGFITVIEYRKKEKLFDVEVSSKILPHIVALAANFTSYDLTVAIALKSTYTQRFYEFCCQYRKLAKRTFYFSLEKLRTMMMLDEKYSNVANFKKRVLDLAQSELKNAFDKEQCDLWFDYRPKETKGRKVLSWAFTIHIKGEENTTDYQTAADALKQVNNILSQFFPRDKKFIARAVKAIQLRPDTAVEIAAKLQKKVFDYPAKDIPPIIRYVMKEDFDIK